MKKIMKTLKIYLNYISFLAVIFAALFFLNLDISLDSKRMDLVLILLSLLLLLFVFILRAVLWWKLLSRFNVGIKFKEAAVSEFKTILAKYIPGKIWGFLNQSNIVSDYGYSLKYCLFISFISQLLFILSGLFIGFIGILGLDLFILPSYILYIFIAIFALCFVLFARGFSIPKFDFKLVSKLLKQLENRKIPPMADLLFLYMLQWLVLGCAYYLFIRSIGFDAGLYPVFIQPLANNIGIITFFAPGGLGVREAVMVGYLSVIKISLQDAAMISLLARLWFLAVEFIAFIIGIAIDSKLIPLILKKRGIYYE